MPIIIFEFGFIIVLKNCLAKGGEVPETDEKDFGLFQPDEDSGVIAAVTAEIEEDNSALGGAENFICAGPGSFPSSTSCSDYFTCTQDGQVTIIYYR